jgi:hypothetical protein
MPIKKITPTGRPQLLFTGQLINKLSIRAKALPQRLAQHKEKKASWSGSFLPPKVKNAEIVLGKPSKKQWPNGVIPFRCRIQPIAEISQKKTTWIKYQLSSYETCIQ